MNIQLETYEWDNIWWEHTENTEAKRVLYIGDSISCGIRRIATEVSAYQILFDGFGTSKALDNPYFADTLKLCVAQQGKRDAVLFNNGLHGAHLSTEEYAAEYRRMMHFLKSIVDEPIFVVLTTDDQREENMQEAVVERNRAAKEIAAQFDAPVIDLATEAERIKNLHADDGIHFTEEGYTVLAKYIVSQLTGRI